MTDGASKNLFDGTMLDGLASTLSVGVETLGGAEAKLSDLISTRDEELERLARSYDDDIGLARRSVTEASQQLSVDRVDALLHEFLVGPVEEAALDIALRRREYTLEKFTDTLVDALKGDERSSQTATRLIAPVLGVAGLLRSIQENGGDTAVAVVNIGWQQQHDSQAEVEGRDSSTGVYEKECNVLLGRIGADAIEIVTKPVDTTSFVIPERPQAVELVFPEGVQRITSGQEWGHVESGIAVTQGLERASLVSDSPSVGWRFNYLSDHDVDWLLSEQIDLSLTEITPINHNLRRSSPKTLLVYGDNVLRAIRILQEDEDVPAVTKTALEQVDLQWTA